jgi:hypothetical protein
VAGRGLPPQATKRHRNKDPIGERTLEVDNELRGEFAAERRLRAAKFGATPEDRMRLRLKRADGGRSGRGAANRPVRGGPRGARTCTSLDNHFGTTNRSHRFGPRCVGHVRRCDEHRGDQQ